MSFYYPVRSGPTLYQQSIHKGCSPEPPESSDGSRKALLGQHSNCDPWTPSPFLGTLLVLLFRLVSSSTVALTRPHHWTSSHYSTAVWLNHRNQYSVPSWKLDRWCYCYGCFQTTLQCKITNTRVIICTRCLMVLTKQGDLFYFTTYKRTNTLYF